MYVNKDKMMVEVQNLPAFSELLARAKAEARQADHETGSGACNGFVLVKGQYLDDGMNDFFGK